MPNNKEIVDIIRSAFGGMFDNMVDSNDIENSIPDIKEFIKKYVQLNVNQLNSHKSNVQSNVKEFVPCRKIYEPKRDRSSKEINLEKIIQMRFI